MKYIRSSLTETIVLSRTGFFMFLAETELITGGVSMYPTLETIRQLARTKEYRRIPLCRELYADRYTPVEVMRILRKASRHCYLLESASQNEVWGRYSFLGYDPSMEITCTDGTLRIRRTKEAREYILTEVMEKCIAGPREHVNEYAPKIVQIKIDPEKIGDVVGQRGKTINAIIDETGVKIDITDDGAVSICGTDQKMMDKAIHYIQTIVTDYKEGQIFTGKVVSIKEFGAFIEFAPGKEGMVHISKISDHRINRVEDVLTLGDKVKVICLGKDKMGRMSFSIKDVPEEA